MGRNYKLAGVVTFGAPKPATKAAYAPVSCSTLRVVNKYDFAPHWPLVTLSHPAKAHKVDSGGWPGPVSRHGIDKYVGVLV